MMAQGARFDLSLFVWRHDASQCQFDIQKSALQTMFIELRLQTDANAGAHCRTGAMCSTVIAGILGPFFSFHCWLMSHNMTTIVPCPPQF